MAITIGRAGRDITLDDPATWQAHGDTITITGLASGLTSALALHLRNQIVGLANNLDEPHVAVTCGEPTLNGYYQVLDASTTIDRAGVTLGQFTWQVVLQQLRDYQAPLLESQLIYGGPLANTHGVSFSSASAHHGVPGSYYQYGARPTPTISNYWNVQATQVVSADGNMAIGTPASTPSNSTPIQVNVQWTCPIADYYRGAAKLEWDTGSGAYRTIVGRQLPSGTISQWRVSNGIVRISTTSGSTLFVEHWDGSQWDTAKQWKIVGDSYVGTITPATMTVLRNSPEVVAVRIVCTKATGTLSTLVTLDVALSRGHHVVRVTPTTSDRTNGEGWDLQLVTSEAATSFTGGIRATNTDAAGNRYLAMSDNAIAKDLTNGRLAVSAGPVQSTRFGIGSLVGGASAAAPAAQTDMVEQFFSQMAEVCRVIAQ